MRLTVIVTPRAARERVERVDGVTLRVAVTAPPHEGRANEAVIRTVAAHLGVAPSRVRIARGRRGRRKLLEIEEDGP
jgi:uncharacterized protein (TIGR00251 family)